MSDQVKIGPKVPREVWLEFREYVDQKRGRTKGTLGDELAQAIQAYMDSTHEADVEQRLENIDAKLDLTMTALRDVRPPEGQCHEEHTDETQVHHQRR